MYRWKSTWMICFVILRWNKKLMIASLATFCQRKIWWVMSDVTLEREQNIINCNKVNHEIHTPTLRELIDTGVVQKRRRKIRYKLATPAWLIPVMHLFILIYSHVPSMPYCTHRICEIARLIPLIGASAIDTRGYVREHRPAYRHWSHLFLLSCTAGCILCFSCCRCIFFLYHTETRNI